MTHFCDIRCRLATDHLDTNTVVVGDHSLRMAPINAHYSPCVVTRPTCTHVRTGTDTYTDGVCFESRGIVVPCHQDGAFFFRRTERVVHISSVLCIQTCKEQSTLFRFFGRMICQQPPWHPFVPRHLVCCHLPRSLPSPAPLPLSPLGAETFHTAVAGPFQHAIQNRTPPSRGRGQPRGPHKQAQNRSAPHNLWRPKLRAETQGVRDHGRKILRAL